MAYKFSLFGKQDAAHEIFGEDKNSVQIQFPEIFQGYDSTCAIRSQQIILRDYGIDVSQEQLIDFASQNGWYSDGTPMGCVGYILQSAGVDVHQQINATVYDLINELAQGHRIIVGVDSGELWAARNHDLSARLSEIWEDLHQGEQADHALIVAGVDVNPKDPSDVKVILTDPGTGDLRLEYSLNQFMDAWEDSGCFMVATNTPAPYQYDETRGVMVPSNFACQEFINNNTFPLSQDTALYDIPDDYSAYYNDGHLDNVGYDSSGKAISFGQYNAKYQSVFGGQLGEDHFDKDKFVNAMKSLLGLGDKHDTTHEKNDCHHLHFHNDGDDDDGFSADGDNDDFDSDDDNT